MNVALATAVRAARPQARRLAAPQRRSLHKNKFCEEWDASKGDLHKKFKFTPRTTASLVLWGAVMPSALFFWVLEDEYVYGFNLSKERRDRTTGFHPSA
mmetsp:Transcript_3771/g.8806  ORF Transcript_3771/g.8806 Transcript_3771/m.8806 type:complete len:99 (-) Transcript_3771:67-363(-)|eukprot:CAMPEP_0202035666 /NCGR_PEP_ID=MMETSP0962-20130828/1026_1 /ASSEMBLY_ACC=CAM_ASM_000488 /TAXON_ID=4773 /ORGANISM="Schizochytrium aggregatum, Strain ATCC28209" /LENGTH=98 /DNA_ID=CAMNT_0048599689 /DNA_START=70 /DNA_END=366 /DNA_ORIENTATION=-